MIIQNTPKNCLKLLSHEGKNLKIFSAGNTMTLSMTSPSISNEEHPKDRSKLTVTRWYAYCLREACTIPIFKHSCKSHCIGALLIELRTCC